MQQFQTHLLDSVVAGEKKLDPYSPTDYKSVRERLLANTRQAFSQRFPVENEQYKLEAVDVDYDEQKPTIADQHAAIKKNGSVTRKLRGRWKLTNKESGAETFSKPRVLMNVPYMTERGTFIRNGSEQSINYMFRLVPGIYSRKKDNGMFEAHVNPKQGTGGQFKIELDPKSGIFRIRQGTRGYKLYTVLKRAGVTDDQIKKSWGDELLDMNRRASDLQHPTQKFNGGVSKTALDKTADYDDLLERLQKTELDPTATEITLGKPHPKLTPETLLDSATKVLKLSRGEAKEDYRDGLEFQKIDGPADYFAERIIRDGGGIARNILWRLSRRGNFEDLPTAPMNKHVDAIFNESRHASYIDGSSMFSPIDLSTRITRIGEGGISGVRTAPSETRAVQDSFAGFIDPVRSVECYDELTEVMTESGWKFFRDLTPSDELACMRNGVLEFHTPEKLQDYDYDGPMYTAKSAYIEYAVTPGHRMYTRPQSHSKKNYHPKYKFEAAEDVAKCSRLVMCGGHGPVKGTSRDFILPPVQPGKCIGKEVQQPRHVKNVTDPIDIGDWCEFLGWYLSEGSFNIKAGEEKGKVSYKTSISQCFEASPENYEAIRKLLEKLPFVYSESYDKKAFTISTKQMALYVSQFGHSSDKFIPKEVFYAPIDARERFVAAAMAGDGGVDTYSGEKHTYHTSSKQLASDMQRLLFGLGWSTRITWRDDDREERYLRMYRVRRHKANERLITHRSIKNYEDGMYLTVPYKGKVYCATVPGGLLYVKRNNSYGMWCGNSLRVGLDLYLANGVRKGDDGRLYTKMHNAKTGKEEWVSSLTAARSRVATKKEFEGEGKYVPAFHGSKGVKIVPKKDIDYFIMDTSNMFSLGANSVPGKSGIMANRLHMGGKYGVQSMPLAQREAPLVRGRQGNTTADEAVGEMMGIRRSDTAGQVVSMDANGITVKGAEGVKTYELYDNYPFNQKGYLRSIPQVKVGDTVKPGQLLASSNFTDDKGVAAQGRNLRVAYINWKGHTYEDAIGISESAAKKLAAEKMYKQRIPVAKNTAFDKKEFLGKFSGKFTKEQMGTISDDGLVKKGTVLRKGDPMIVAVRHNEAKPGSLGRKTRTALTETWDHDYEGVVVGADKGDKNATVYTRANIPMKNGDKMCYDAETEILTEQGWCPVVELNPGDVVASLNPSTHVIEYVPVDAMHVYEHKGRMHSIETTQVSLCTTEEHRQYAQRRDRKEYELLTSAELFGKRYRLLKNGEWEGTTAEAFKLPDVYKTLPKRKGVCESTLVPGPEIPIDTYLMVMGLFLSEGNVVWQEKTADYGFDITQTKGDNPQIIRDAFDTHGIKWCECSRGTKVRVYSKHWATYLRQFGKSYEKRIPKNILALPPEKLKIFYEWFMFGDGHRTQAGHGITTSSYGLAGDWQQLCLHLGMSATVKKAFHKETYIKGRKINSKRPYYKVSIYRRKNQPTINHGHSRTQSGQVETWVEYDGMVYCPELSRNHIVYTRRNGKTVWSGNSSRYAAKGIVNIIPDNQMPLDKDGNPLDVLLSPLGLISRVNPMQVVEAMAGKRARKTGKPEVIEGFDTNMIEKYEQKLKEAGLTPTETLFDPATGREIPEVLTGEAFYYRLMHMAEDKGGGRGVGASTGEETPLRGGRGGAKQMGGLHTSALVSHGAMKVLKDAKLIRGQCFTPDTEVLTERGWVHWGQVEAADKLYTRSKEDQTKAWFETPERLVGNPFDGELCGYEGRHVDWLVTPNHKFWGVRGFVSRKKPWRKHQTMTAESLFGKECSVDAYGAVYQGSLTPEHPVVIEGTAHSPAMTISITNYCRLLGWWLSEGCASIDEEGRGRVRISQLKEINSDHFDEIEGLLRSIGFARPYHEKHYGASPLTPSGSISANIMDGAVVGLRVNSASLARHLKQFGASAHNKNIPEIIYEAPLEARREFLRCYVAGDGCIRKEKRYGSTNWYVSSSSEAMIQGLQRVALLNGMSAHLGVCKGTNKTYKGTHYRMVCGYSLTEVSVVKRPSAKYKGHYTQSYKGTVYCATMTTGMIYVRKNGKAMWSENSNDNFWRDFRMGRMPKMPGNPLVNQKFYEHLKGAGINVDENSERVNFFGMTNEQARKLVKGHELKVARTYDQKNMNPIDGGLFDPKLFGENGDGWGFIQLDEPLPNPVMEPAIASILGLSQKNFNEVMSGERKIGDKTGGAAVSEALKNVDMKSAVKQSLEDLRSAKPSKKDKALKRYRFLKSMQEQDVEPNDFMMDRVPVLPPKFRPVTQLDGTNITADANMMYRSLLFARDDMRQARERLPDDMIKGARKHLYSSYKALTGMYDPDDAKLQDKNVQGLLKWVFGKGSAKYGAYQRRILGTAMNLAGRGVVQPNPAMPLNKIGIPIKDAWDVFEPFVVRNMVKHGYAPTDAIRRVKKRDKSSESFLREAVKERPVIVNRAPSLHRYSVMAFEPQLVKGSSVQVSPSIVGPFGMDFDGDTVTYYTPVSKEAVEEARKKMTPQANLLSPRSMSAHYTPQNEFVQGLYLATRPGKGTAKRTFETQEDAQKAYNNGEIDIDTPIVILEKEKA